MKKLLKLFMITVLLSSTSLIKVSATQNSDAMPLNQFVEMKANLENSKIAKDKNGEALTTGKKYYMILTKGNYNPGIISSDVIKSESHGITTENYMGTTYLKLADDKGVPVVLYHKDFKEVPNIKVGKNDAVYIKLENSNQYLDFPNDDSWGSVYLNSSPEGGVSNLVQNDNFKTAFLTCSNITWYNGSQGLPGNWPFDNTTSIRKAWLSFKSGTFFNSSKRWLTTSLPAGGVPWANFIFEPCAQ